MPLQIYPEHATASLTDVDVDILSFKSDRNLYGIVSS